MVLQKLRDRVTGLLAIFILGLLAVPFALVGVNSYFAPDTENNVAIVNDEGITLNDFQASFQNYRDRMQSLMGQSFDPEQFDGPVVRREHLETMIERTLLRQASAETGLSVDDQTLAREIRELPAFQIDGQFSPDVYQSQLAAQGVTPQEFENQIRASMVLSQYPGTIRASAIATAREVDEYIRLQEQKRAFAALLVKADQGNDPVTNEANDQATEADAERTDEEADQEAPEVAVDEERILAWYDEHPDDYRYPERVVIDYLELNAEDLELDEGIDEDTLRQRFEDQSARFITPEARLASHILISIPPTADEAEIETAREKAQALRDRAVAGEDFAELARENSEDQGSAASGGDLDWVEPGFMVEAFENALYELSMESPISEPVQTGFGWHVIQLREIRPAEGMTFEEARETLESEYIAEERERKYLEIADRLIDVIYEDPTTLEAAADEFSLEIKTAGPFDRRGEAEGAAANPEFVETAFSDLVLLQGSASDLVNLGPNHVAILKLNEHLPEAAKPLEEVRDDIVAAISHDDAMKAAEVRATGLLERLQAGDQLQTLADESGLEIVESEGAGRLDSSVPVQLRGEVFLLSAPAEGEVSRQVVALADGYAVVELREVIPGVLTEEEATRRDSYRRRLANVSASSETQAFLDLLREQSTIEVFEDRL